MSFQYSELIYFVLVRNWIANTLKRQIFWSKIPLLQCISLFTDLLPSIFSLVSWGCGQNYSWNYINRKSIARLFMCSVHSSRNLRFCNLAPWKLGRGQIHRRKGGGGAMDEVPPNSTPPSVSPPVHLNAGELASHAINQLLIVLILFYRSV